MKDHYSTSDVCHMVDISRRTLYRHIKSGRVIGVQDGERAWWFKASDLVHAYPDVNFPFDVSQGGGHEVLSHGDIHHPTPANDQLNSNLVEKIETQTKMMFAMAQKIDNLEKMIEDQRFLIESKDKQEKPTLLGRFFKGW